METRSLTPESWLDLALEALKSDGYTALKAQPLAKKLNVTRGSFYHHFDSLEAFHAAVIAHWSARTSGQIAEAARGFAVPGDALEDLLQKTLRSGEALERAIRSWSTVAPDVAEAVARVDQERIAIAQDLLEAAGVPEQAAASRARLLYWAAIGRLMLPFPDRNMLSQNEISEIAALMLTR